MKRVLFVLFLSVVAGAVVASAGQPTSFTAVLEHYEIVRLALLNDSAQEVAVNGEAIASQLRALQADFTAEKAGVAEDAASAVQDGLPGMIAAADSLAGGPSLADARNAFYDLSKGLVRWREGVQSTRPVVAYCPMVKKSWLQPDGSIGNPYGGRHMPSCGQIVSK